MLPAGGRQHHDLNRHQLKDGHRFLCATTFAKTFFFLGSPERYTRSWDVVTRGSHAQESNEHNLFVILVYVIARRFELASGWT